MGNSCSNKIAPLCSGCCASPIICTAHISCSVPIWCGCPTCCSDPRVQPVEEPQPLPRQFAPETPAQQSEAQRITNALKPKADGSGTPIGYTIGLGAPQLVAEKQKGREAWSATGAGHALTPKSGTLSQPAQVPVDSFERVAELAVALETGEPVGSSKAVGAAQRGTANAQPGVEESTDEEIEQLSAFEFNLEAMGALERFELMESCARLITASGGRPVVQAIQSMCLYALDAGAAAWNCKRLLEQIRWAADFLAHALDKGGLRNLVREALQEVRPVMERGEAAMRCWDHKGSVDKFFSGRAADEEFFLVHAALRNCCQSAPFTRLLQSMPLGQRHQAPAHTPDGDGDDPKGSKAGIGASASAAAAAPPPPSTTTTALVDEPSGYGSVEASRVAFERLLMLFILRYKPLKTRTQKARLMDLLHVYNSMVSGLAEKMEHLVVTRLDKTATGALPLLRSVLTNMWGATKVPRARVDRWRLAVRLALEPLMVVTGEWQLPQTPEEDVQEFVEEKEEG